MPAKHAVRWLAPAAPVFAGSPAPTELAPVLKIEQNSCFHRYCTRPKGHTNFVGAGSPAKQATRWLAPAAPVFAAKAAPTGIAPVFKD
ncbi:hypothetical protein C6A77_11455 [Pseudomonas sp. AFG_SD02_1510_Pfu_092]|nr:hypothetical protein C6A77_11455 [Pseudomonas sp. AFG_SD02_1510_Pfu_092]